MTSSDYNKHYDIIYVQNITSKLPAHNKLLYLHATMPLCLTHTHDTNQIIGLGGAFLCLNILLLT